MIETLNFSNRLTKRNILQTLASIFDPLGFSLLIWKVIYQNVCDVKIPWDKEVSKESPNQWLN